jgi:hypothetical protein
MLLAAASPPVVQAITPRVSVTTIGVMPAPVGIIQGDVLERLRDGRSLRLELSLEVKRERSGPPIAQVTEAFTVSFDLWEERFAAMRIGTPKRSVSHLRAAEVEAWCVGQLGIERGALSALGRDGSFWLRLEYRVPGEQPSAEREGLTLRTLIDTLSRRAGGDPRGRTLEAGPFRLAD